MGGLQRREMMRVLLLVTCVAALVLGSAVAFDCDKLQEPDRTHCLDRAAESNIGMSPVHNHVVEPVAQRPVSLDDDSVDDVMGDLGEASKTTAKMSARDKARAELKADMVMAERKAQGLFNDDVRVARAFSDLDDSMDALKHHLHHKTHIRETENRYLAEEDREEDEERELGESDTMKEASKPESNGVLDASAADLDKDLTVNFEHRALEAPNTEKKVDDLMKELHSSFPVEHNDDTSVSVLDDAAELR